MRPSAMAANASAEVRRAAGMSESEPRRQNATP